VDGFNQHQPACKTDDGGVADVGLFAAHGDALEPLELADGLFDARTASNTSSVIRQSCSVIPVSMSGSLVPVTQ
jgi:hypothetical protein